MLPVFGLVLCGWGAGRARLVGAESSDALNQFVYYFALPAMLFAAVSRGSLEQILDWPFLGGVVMATLACAAAGFAVSAWLQCGTPQAHSLRALNASFSNTGYLGIPLVTVAYGPEAALPAAMAAVATNVMLFAAGLTLLELFDRRHAEHGKGIALALLGTARSPLIWPLALAIALVAAGLSLPLPLMRLAELLAAAAGPGALFALGLFFSRQSMREGMATAWPGVVLKLVLHPLIAVAVFYGMVSVDPLWAKVAVVGASLPLGATAFVLAQRYKLLEVETSCSAVLSTALSVFSVSVVMSVLA
ncbi:MAG: AEC family transporter [Proteobacteria bacterium]|nr:AEC family transporter [Pseudomonadota bacterium]MDA0983142.1 AEC family transporter [Pseudomonadota bacterium]